MTDEGLIQRALAGDREAFAEYRRKSYALEDTRTRKAGPVAKVAQEPLTINLWKAAPSVQEARAAARDRWAALKQQAAAATDPGDVCDLIEAHARSEYPELPHHRAVEKLLGEAGPELRVLYERGKEQRLGELSAEQREQATLMQRVRDGDAEAFDQYRKAAYAKPRDPAAALSVSKRAERVVTFRKQEEEPSMETDVFKQYDFDPRERHAEQVAKFEAYVPGTYVNRGQLATLAKSARVADDFDEQLQAVAREVSQRDGMPVHEAALRILKASRALAVVYAEAARGHRPPAVWSALLSKAYRVASSARPGGAERAACAVVAAGDPDPPEAA